MASLATFGNQLKRCAQDQAEILAFVEAFAKVRLNAQLTAPPAVAVVEKSEDVIRPDWSDPALLAVSGIDPDVIAGRTDPERFYLHIEMALRAPRAAIEAYLSMTGLSDKQRRAMFPGLSVLGRGKRERAVVEEDTRRNGWLDWVRSEGVDPALFPIYQRHVGIHGASQNVGGRVGAAGAIIAFMDALTEIAPGRIREMVGSAVPDQVRTPLQIYEWQQAGGQAPQAMATVVDCPISGGSPGARAGTLSVMVSGDPAAVERIRPMISLWGRTLTVAGDKPGAAQVLKLTNNILSAVALAATAEAFVMGAKGGLDPEVMVAAINAGSGRNSATESKFPVAVLTRSFDYGAEMHILMKDIDLAIAQGEELGVPMWVCEAARLVFKHAMHKGASKEDLTAIVKYLERDAGFEIPKTR